MPTTFRQKKAEASTLIPLRQGSPEGEQVPHMPEKNKEEASGSREKPQEELVPTPKAWRLYVGREAVKEGFIVGMILNSPERKMFSYAIRLNFHTSEDSMDYEALLARLTASTGRGMKDLHVFVGSKLLVDQVEGSRIPRTKEAKKYREEVKDVTAPFHRFRITHLP
ncbi:reverse transcriptase domain-containing protein [Tanacetum coccineum]|uniref:Reverse transcriptase domain-containing protein n=1 Tax=Tanacetum coccineum TaxID=301880 RepID=A0ABQ5BME1_9ASTR